MAEQDQQDQDREVKAMDVKRFLDDPRNPLTTEEFSDFWKSLTDEEKAEFKRTLPF